MEIESAFDFGTAFDWNFSLRPYVIASFMGKYSDQNANGTWSRMQNISKWYVSWGLTFDHPEWDLRAKLHLNTQTEQTVSSAYVARGWTKSVFGFEKSLYSFENTGKITLVGEIDNLFNRDYFIYRNTTESLYRMPGRSFYLGVKYEYQRGSPRRRPCLFSKRAFRFRLSGLSSRRLFSR
jgi:vitamin B12 transporter